MGQVPDPEPASCLRAQGAPTLISPCGSRGGRETCLRARLSPAPPAPKDGPRASAAGSQLDRPPSPREPGLGDKAHKGPGQSVASGKELLQTPAHSLPLQSRDSFGRDSPRLSCPEITACSTLACKSHAHRLPPRSTGCRAGGGQLSGQARGAESEQLSP